MTFILRYWKAIAVASFVILCLSWGFVQSARLASAHATISDLEVKYSILEQRMLQQNRAIQAWKEEAEKRARDAKEATKEARKYRSMAAEKRKQLEAVKPSGNECEDLSSLIDTYRS